MGRAKNTLNPSDVSSIPVKLRYNHVYDSVCLEEEQIAVKLGINITYSDSLSSQSLDEMNNYRMIRQVYYQQAITGSVLNSASFWDPFWVSTAAVGTYDSTYYNFPTEEDSAILIVAIPSSKFGEQVGRKSFSISSSKYDIGDDGNGNLFDYSNEALDLLATEDNLIYETEDSSEIILENQVGFYNGLIHVGNIFYAQGIAVITNQNYVPNYNYLSTENQYIYETENNFDVILEN